MNQYPPHRRKRRRYEELQNWNCFSELINECENRPLNTSQESPSSISNVMEIVRKLLGVKEDTNFVIQAFYVLMKRSHRETFPMFKELES